MHGHRLLSHGISATLCLAVSSGAAAQPRPDAGGVANEVPVEVERAPVGASAASDATVARTRVGDGRAEPVELEARVELVPAADARHPQGRDVRLRFSATGAGGPRQREFMLNAQLRYYRNGLFGAADRVEVAIAPIAGAPRHVVRVSVVAHRGDDYTAETLVVLDTRGALSIRWAGPGDLHHTEGGVCERRRTTRLTVSGETHLDPGMIYVAGRGSSSVMADNGRVEPELRASLIQGCRPPRNFDAAYTLVRR